MSKLAEAKQILAERGRTAIGVLEDSNGCVCPLGALNVAYYGAADDGVFNGEETWGYDFDERPGQKDDILALAQVAFKRLGENRAYSYPSYHDIYRYNDGLHGDEHDQEVLSLFDEAMELANG